MVTYTKEEEIEIVELASSFLLYFGFNDPKNKRITKKVHRTIKNKLAVHNRKDPKRYLELVNMAGEINQKALDKMILEDSGKQVTMISPYHYLALLVKHTDAIKKLDGMRDYLDSIGSKSDDMLYASIMFFNRVKDEVGLIFDTPWDRGVLAAK